MNMQKKTCLLSGVFILLFIIIVTPYLFSNGAEQALSKGLRQTTLTPHEKPDILLQYDSFTKRKSTVHNDSESGNVKTKAEFRLTKTTKASPFTHKTTHGKIENTQEKTHVEFLKVHKAASSTVQSILLRFGLKRNLSFVIPTPTHYISTTKYFFSDIWPSLQKTSNGTVCDGINSKHKYDMLTHHMVFNHKKVSQLLHSDTVYVAIVRDPFDVFVAAVRYYKFGLRKPYAYLGKLSNKTFITDLIRNPKQFEATTNSESMTYNSMCYDFGLECLNAREPEMCTDEIFAAFLNSTRDIFDVVMVVERFDESLVFLRRYMNWSLKDILYMKINTFSSDQFSNMSACCNVTSEDMAIFKERNKFDYGLYNLFKNRLEKQISNERNFEEEVEHFKIIQQDVQHFCSRVKNTDTSLTNMDNKQFQYENSTLENKLNIRSKQLLKSIKEILTTKTVSLRQQEELYELFDLVENGAIETPTVSLSKMLPLLFEDKVNTSRSQILIAETQWSKSFYVTTHDCVLMMKDIMSLYEVVKHRHLKSLFESKFGDSYSLTEAVKFLSTFT